MLLFSPDLVSQRLNTLITIIAITLPAAVSVSPIIANQFNHPVILEILRTCVIIQIHQYFCLVMTMSVMTNQTVENLLKQHRIRRMNAHQVLQILKTPGFPVADGTVQAACANLEIAFQQLELIQQQHRKINRKIETVIERLCESAEDESGHSWQRDVNLLSSIPGIGHKILATLLSEAPDAWQRRDLPALRCLCGIAPITKQSGKSRLVIRRLACNGLLRNASYHWANIAIRRQYRHPS